MRLAPWNWFKPSSEYFTYHSEAVILLWIVFVSYASCRCVLCCCVCSLQPCGHLLGKSLPLGCRVCCFFLCFVTFPNVSWSTSELRVRLGPWNWLKPSSKIFLLPVPRQYFFCESFMFFLACVCYAFMHVCLFVPCGHLLGKGWPLGSSLWCLIVSLSLSHWYPGSGVVLDCMDSWSLHSYLLCTSASPCKMHSARQWPCGGNQCPT